MSKSNPHLNAHNEAAVNALIADDMSKLFYQINMSHFKKTFAIAELAKHFNVTKSVAKAAAWYW